MLDLAGAVGRLAFESIVQRKRARGQPGSRLRPVRDALPVRVGRRRRDPRDRRHPWPNRVPRRRPGQRRRTGQLRDRGRVRWVLHGSRARRRSRSPAARSPAAAPAAPAELTVSRRRRTGRGARPARARAAVDRPLDRFGGELVDLVGRPQPLRDVTAAVVHLQEAPSVAPARRRPAVPDVGHEEDDVAGVGGEEHGRPAVVGQVRIVDPVRTAPTGPTGGCPARRPSGRRLEWQS